MTSYGLVLEGGGSKGSYQLGAALAVIKKNIPILAVVGTSIGAFNAALLAQGDMDRAYEIWTRSGTSGEDEGQLVAKKGKNRGHFREMVEVIGLVHQAGHMDVAPFREMVKKEIDEKRVRQSKVRFGLVVFNLSKRKTQRLFIEDIPEGQLHDYILASCAFPGLPSVDIGGDRYIDGGVGDNIPYKMVQDLGLRPLILRTNPNLVEDKLPGDSLVIAPGFEVGNPLVFDPAQARKMIDKGYRDGLRVLGGYEGEDYSFEKITESQAFALLSRLFLSKTKDLSYLIGQGSSSVERQILEELWPQLALSLGLDQNYTYKALLLALVEEGARQHKLDPAPVYKLEAMVEEIFSRPAQFLGPPRDPLLQRVITIIFTRKTGGED
ncbi:MAG: patatin-like phospholipase family protein [Tissierellia bacterium]|nr:patatin-like phospholipase family protein [Tissierellia bacterium]